MKFKLPWKFKVILHFAPSNAGYQKLQANNNKVTVMDISEQLPSRQGRRQGKKDDMNPHVNYEKPDAMAAGQGCGRMERGGGHEKF